MITFTDCSLNLKYNNTPAEHIADLTKMAQEADICGLQEVQTPAVRRALFDWLVMNKDWSVVWGGEAPIVYRHDMFTVIERHLYTVAGAEAYVNPPRVINMVVFNVSGKQLTYINTHVEQQFTHEYLFTRNYRKRVAKARAGIEELRKFGSVRGAVRLGGDLNISLNNKLRKWYPYTLKRAFEFDVTGGLDHIGYKDAILSNPRGVRVHSDHLLRLVHVEL